jgi:hypothetical protein
MSTLSAIGRSKQAISLELEYASNPDADTLSCLTSIEARAVEMLEQIRAAKAKLTDGPTVCHERPPLVCQQTTEHVLGIK